MYRYTMKMFFKIGLSVSIRVHRASFVKPQYSASRADSGSQTSNTLQSGSKATPRGAGDKAVIHRWDFLPFSVEKKKSGSWLRPSMNGSSSEISEEDELVGENDIMENTDPADARRDYLKENPNPLSNVGCSTKSPKRTLLKHLTEISQKYNNATVCNRVLKADVETLEAKVKFAEESVKRIFGLSYISTKISTKRVSSCHQTNSFAASG
ncbi:hypothetical protein F3Y22_tig00110890pilonHSYRG00265 [Hibiscus syriacus]|uniref:Basic leucine-zipper C-terminal domain-containing protein n=1 Tax=Hibiscus syriacus TaxID=106335 RepID=A0A6A2ZI79_HIBSY|nr:hypothetical protein F3Y22_tig00110890pilonHSYRG00265 [Hibiscus syriacus]